MSYKSILVNLDIDGPIKPVVKASAELARRSGARLIGFCAADAYLPVTGPEGATLAADVWQQMREDDERRFKELRKEFEALVAGTVETEWRDALERPTYALVQASRMADLVVTQAVDGAATRDTPRRSDPGSAILQTGRPVLVVGTDTEHRLGRKILVAWKDTREAPYSCVKERTQLASTMTPMMTASLPSPTIPDTTAAKMRMRTSGLRNCRAKVVSAEAPRPARIALAPTSSRRALASPLESPDIRVSSCARSTSAGIDQ